MSYDVYLTMDTGGEHHATVMDVGNHTSNTVGMWRLALGFPLSDIQGRRAGDCVADLARAVAHMTDPANAAEYEAMNPPNGWGSHKTATRFLATILAACKAHPNTTVDISR